MENSNTPYFRRWGEISFIFATIFTTMGVALMTKADFGLSMIVAPAYIISEVSDILTFGMSEYIVQAILLAALFVIIRRVEWRYALSFLSAIIYGAVLDLFIMIFNSNSVPDDVWVRVLLYIVGLLASDFGVALYFKSYLPPCAYDLFVREASGHLHIKMTKFKIAYDWSSFAVAIILSLLFFKGLHGIGIGTIACVAVNGPLIGLFSKLHSRYIDFSPRISKLHSLIAVNAGVATEK
ncbi:MAG: hypothetical protein GX192_08130 [Clostridiales bacterium]|nr:hypothetical protein [Clostridiales bacterium]